mgnify:CR=1 FL=1
MGKYTNEVPRLLELLGGKENISAATHCMTRLRLGLKDPDKAQVKEIEALPTVKGSFTQAGQFQIVIGNDVSTYYKELAEIAGFETAATKDDVKEPEPPAKSRHQSGGDFRTADSRHYRGRPAAGLPQRTGRHQDV